MEEVVAAVVGAILSGGITWVYTRGDLGQKNSMLEAQLKDSNKTIKSLTHERNEAQKKANRLSEYEKKYNDIKRSLSASSVVKEFFQPVILVGPRGVGKTSLLAQWHTPWDHSRLQSTHTHNISTVPIYDFKRSNTEPHFADPEILTDVHVHLKLRIHDFPGELGSQRNIIDQTIQETIDLRRSTRKSLGIVLLCLFDAEEVVKGLSQSTIEYYNGDLFANLRQLVSQREVGIERLVLIFNKYDLLKRSRANQDDVSLLKGCLEIYKPVLYPLKSICNPEKVCEVFTVLSREDMAYNNRGAPIVIGESARNFVEAMAGSEVAREVIKESATTYSAPLFS